MRGEGVQLLLEGVRTSITKKKQHTVKPVLSGNSKIDNTKILMTNCSLMKVESIAECSPWNACDTELKDIVITGDFNLNYLHITFRSLINLKTVKIPVKINATP